MSGSFGTGSEEARHQLRPCGVREVAMAFHLSPVCNGCALLRGDVLPFEEDRNAALPGGSSAFPPHRREVDGSESVRDSPHVQRTPEVKERCSW